LPSRGLQLLAPGWIKLAQPPHPFPDWWMRDEQGCQPFLEERVDRVERLRRGTATERDELRGLVEADESVGHRVRRAADRRRRGVGQVFALRRQHQVHERRGDRAEDEQERALEPAT